MRTAVAILMSGVLLVAGRATAEEIPIIPRPAEAVPGDGRFALTPRTIIVVDKTTRAAGKYLAEALAAPTGYRLEVRDSSRIDRPVGLIFLSKAKDSASLGAEGYPVNPLAIK